MAKSARSSAVSWTRRREPRSCAAAACARAPQPARGPARARRHSPMQKSSVEEIRQRFDADVERFANLETGQAAIIDAPLVLDLITSAAAAATAGARDLLDVGCGAVNYTLKTLERLK